MTTTVYLLVNSDLGKEIELIKELQDIPSVTEAHLIYGNYDIILKMQGESMDQLKEIITAKIRRNDKVRSTLTMVVANPN